jgi:ABC-2 type transport system permease protein
MIPRESTFAYSPRRTGAMMLRYWYLLRSSWPRLLDLVYWPTVQMITWGFLQYYIMQNAGFFARAGGTFIGAVLLWDILFRGQLGFSISFMEEMWARNIGNLMMSPLRPLEFISALMVMSIVRLAVGAVPVTVLAILFFGFNLYGLGFALVAFFLQPDADGLGGRDFRVRPGAAQRTWRGKSCLVDHVFVHAADLRLLPGDDAADLAAAGAWLLPPTYVFEGMRALLIEKTFRPDLMLDALALNVVFFAAGVFGFLKLLQSARQHGSLLQSGE